MRTSPVMDGRHWRHLASGVRLLLLLYVFPGAQTASCKSVFSPISGDMPKDFSLKVGEPLVLNCTLETPEFTISGNRYSVNGSHLEIKFNDSQVPSELLTVGDMWVAFRKERSEYSDTGNYNCNIRAPRVFHVCATQVTVGDPPLPVENFRCISYYYKNLTCYWEPPPNSVKTEYALGERFAILPAHKGWYRKCPLVAHSGNESSCAWTVSSKPALRKETKLFHLVMNATNALGFTNFSFFIEHLKIVKISEPTEFKCSAVSKRSITLSWNASIEQSENPKLLVIYQIHYQSQYESTSKIVEVFNKTSHMIQNLNPYTAYTFRLRGRASEAVQEYFWTDEVVLSQTTLKDVPEAPPRISRSGFKVQNYQSRRTIVLNFAALPEKKWGGATLQYLITCCEDNAPEDSCENKTVEMPTVAFEGLHRNSRYNFQLWSVNEIGPSQVHSSLQVDKYDELINAPQDIEVVAHGSGSYVVSWRAPSARMPVQTSSTSTSTEEQVASLGPLGPISYTVFWCPRMLPRSYSCNESVEWRKTEINASSIVLSLDPANVYQFAVAAQTADKASESHWTTCVLPVSKELEKITQVTLEKNGGNSLLMHWQLECSSLKSYVNGYQIEACEVLPKYQKMALHDANGCMYSKYDPKTCKVYNITDRDDEEAELSGLSGSAVYRAVIRASSNGKLTEDSPAQCARTELGKDVVLIVGSAVGATVAMTLAVIGIYWFARWLKGKVDDLKEIKIQLPDGLDSSEANQMHSYKNNKNGSAGKTSEGNRSPHIAYGRMGCFSAADNAGPKKRHDSGRSQGSSSSTEELLYKKTRRADTFGRNPSGDSSGGSTNGQDSVVSASTARTGATSSCDSGAESDPAAPPSPDCLLLTGNHTPLARCRPNLPKLDEDRVRESQDSGLDTEVTPPIVIPSSDSSQPSYSKLVATPDVQAPLLQSQALATSEPSLFEGSENVPEPVEPLPPYSKFGLARSSEDVSTAPYTTCRLSPGTRRQDGPPALPYSQLALRQQPGVNGLPAHAFPSTDVTVGLALEQPRLMPNLKSRPMPLFPKPQPSAYVTVGQAMKTQPPVTEPQSGPAYSKFGIQPPKPLTRPDIPAYVPLQAVVGVHHAALPATTVPAEEPGPRDDHFRDADSSSDDVAIVGDDNSNNASLEDFSFSSASGPGADELAEACQSPLSTSVQTPVSVEPAAKPPPLDLTSEPQITSNGYTRLPCASPSETRGVTPYVTHVAAFDWGRSAPKDGETDVDNSALPPPTSAPYVVLPNTADTVNSRTSAVSFVPGVKPERVDCSV
uniref:Cell adhesion molecule n=1 Tax=Rhipicephalus zambeziensis TaxID=60191 RepID=A0A224YPW6_9ACAR